MKTNNKACPLRAASYLLSIFLLCLCFSSCGLGKYGAGELSYFESKRPDGLKNKTKPEIVSRLGVPERVALEGDREYWWYSKRGGWGGYIPPIPLFGTFLGITKSKNLVLEFQGDRVASYYLLRDGFSFAICNMPGAVAN